MKIEKRKSLLRRMLFYFLLISIAVLFISSEMIYQLNKSSFKNMYVEVLKNYKANKITLKEAFKPIYFILRKMIAGLVILVVLVSIVLYMFVKDIALPIQYIVETAKKISAGDLSQTVRVKGEDELTMLGDIINELTSNLQELIMLSAVSNKNMENSTKKIKDCLYKLPEVKTKKELIEVVKCIARELKKLENISKEMKMVLKAFQLYGINIEEE